MECDSVTMSSVEVEEIRFRNQSRMWGTGLVVGDHGRAEVNVKQVAIAGAYGFAGGHSSPGSTAHEILAVAGEGGNAEAGDGGIAVCSAGASGGMFSGVASVQSRGVAYAKGTRAIAKGGGSVAMSHNGRSEAARHSIAVAWLQKAADNGLNGRAEAGDHGIAIGHHGTRVKAGNGGTLIALDDSMQSIPTLVCRVGEGGIEANQWYRIVLENKAFRMEEA